MPRIDGIKKDVGKLRELAQKPIEEFRDDEDALALAQFYLRQALEGIFHIGEHILSRLQGGRTTEYKETARRLGEKGIVERDFAETKLIAMAGYRNRLTHFYASVTVEEMYSLLQNNLDDFDEYLSYVKQVVENPEKLGLTLE